MITAQQETLMVRVRAAFEDDPRVLALWVEGSLGRGEGDPWSDVDAHVAVADAAWDAFGETPEVLARIGVPLGYLEGPPTAPGLRILPATLAIEGAPVRLDLYLERRSRLARAPRARGRRMIFDTDGCAGDLEAAPPLAFDARSFLQGLMRAFFFGAMWPRRLTGREDWGSLLMNATGVVYQFAVPAMLIADGSPEFYREPHGRARFLGPARQAQVRALLDACVTAFHGIGEGAPDPDALARFHERFFEAVWRAFREACAATGLEYPRDAEAVYRRYYARELGLEVPPLP